MTMLNALVTDANYKHAVALARHAKKVIPDSRVVGHDAAARGPCPSVPVL